MNTHRLTCTYKDPLPYPSRDMRRLLKSLAENTINSRYEKVGDRIEREIQQLASFRDSDEIHNYVVGLEADLSDLEIPEKRWKRILLKKLTPKARKVIRDFVCKKSCTYRELRAALVEKLGPTKTEVTEKLFGSSEHEFR